MARLFETPPENTHEAIMAATYDALCRYGYADLTVERIGQEFEKSVSLIYHHYDGKDELLIGFLKFMIDRAKTEIDADGGDDAYMHLRTILDHMLPPTLPDEQTAFVHAMAELRAQAAHDGVYRAQFTESDQFFKQTLATIIRRGIEQGTFRPINPDRAAALLVTIRIGGMTQRVTADNDTALRATCRELDEYIETRLFSGTDGNR